MPFIEDQNGLAFYFSREQWELIAEVLEDFANFQINYVGDDVDIDPYLDIVEQIRTRVP